MSRPSRTTLHRSPAYWPEVARLEDLAAYLKQYAERMSFVEVEIARLFENVRELKHMLRANAKQRARSEAKRHNALKRQSMTNAAALQKLIRQQGALTEALEKVDVRHEQNINKEVKFNNIRNHQ